MYKQVVFHGNLNERTGYGVHASRFTEQLSKLIPVSFIGEGDVHVSLLDVVTAAHTTVRHPYPSILYTVWESTEYPAEFMEKLKLYDQLWVPSEWQKANSIAQGIPEEFVKVVPEGVDPDVYKPHLDLVNTSGDFRFLHVGQWQPRKSTKEIVGAFLKAFPDNQNVRLYLSTDTLFPSDTYKSTEERLVAYGLSDPRIIPIHFEERDAYIRRLQSAHVFLSCSRSEGWNLPLIEAMACGIPATAADFGGSTEYASDALLVRISELKKPEGIYGNWDVPGKWGEPDYNHLVDVMQDAYQNYSIHKEKALKTSEMIRTKFSWVEAARKAYDIIQTIPQDLSKPLAIVQTPEESIRQFARSLGYEIKEISKRSAIFSVDCHPDCQEKLDTLIETIKQIKSFGYPVLISSHLPLPVNVIEMADYYIYDKKDTLSGDDKPRYWRPKPDGTVEFAYASIPCHALAALANVRNALDFCLGKYEWVYQMSSDTEVDLGEWLKKVHASNKDMICCGWENQPETISGQLTAIKAKVADKITPRLSTWEEFVNVYGDSRFNSEHGYYKIVKEKIGIENIDILNVELGNRFNQVDKEAWKDDLFQCNFVEGPFLNIIGLSEREYDVTFSNPIDGDFYALKQKTSMWSRPDKKCYRDWTVTAKRGNEVKFQHTMNLKGTNVIISMGSKALGDTLAWIPYIEEFRKKHGCNIYCSTWWNGIMDYPEIHFITPGDTVQDVYASYEVGCFDNQPNKNPFDWRLTPLQKVAADILGVDYEPLRAKLKYEPHKSGNGNEPKPYICFSEFSTMRNKIWNREGGWQNIIDYLNGLGYDCVSVSTEPSQLTGIVKHNGQSIEQTLTDISGASFYIGLNAGPTWIAYALNVPCIMITGVSEEWNDFPNPYRVAINNEVCGVGCFNDPSLPIDRGWDWCPRKKDYACTRDITESMVITQIDKIREVLKCQSPSRKKTAGMKSVHQTKSMPKKQVSKRRKPKKDSLMQSSMAGTPAMV